LPMRFVLASLAIAIGVALAFAVHVIKRAVRSASGGADLQVRGVARGVQADPRQPPGMFPAHSSVPGRCAPCCRR
jgi:hypothetical protein